MAENWDERLQELEDLGPTLVDFAERVVNGGIWVLEQIRLFALVIPIAAFVGLVAVVLFLIARAWPLWKSKDAIAAQTQVSFVNTVGNARGQQKARSAQSADKIIRQCVFLGVGCAVLAAFLI